MDARRADVDLQRAVAVVLVLVVHSAQVFSPWQIWHIQNDARSRLLAELTLFAGPWLMALFMLLAGRSAYHSLARRNNRTYLRERVERILVPLVVGVLLLVPPQVWASQRHAGTSDDGFLTFYPHFFSGLPPEGNLSWGHLWFLAYLFLYGVALLPLLRRLRPRLDRWQGRVWNGGSLAGFVVVMALLQVLLRAPYPQTNALLGDWANHAQLIPAFLFGYAFAADAGLRHLIVRCRHLCLTLGVLVSFGIALFAWPGNFGARLPERYSWTYALFWSGATVATWTWLFAITGTALLRVRRASPVLGWTRDIVYAFYVLHQPILVFVAWWVVPASLPVALEFLVVFLLAFAATLAACELVRRSGPGRRLLGLKPTGSPSRVRPLRAA